MAIDIYRRKQYTELLFQLDEKLYARLAPVVLKEFERRTGVFIDEYGDTLLSFQHAGTLGVLLQQAIDLRTIQPDAAATALVALLNKAVADETDLDLLGD